MATAKKATPGKRPSVSTTPMRVSARTPIAKSLAIPLALAVAKTTARAIPQQSPALPSNNRPGSVPDDAVKPPNKSKKPKLVRDSFTIPKAEYVVLEDLKQRAAGMSAPAKKSELLRAGIKALAAMADAALRDALRAVPAIKTGRPGKA